MKRRLRTAWRVPDPCSSPVRAELVEAWTGSATMVGQRAHPSTSSGRAEWAVSEQPVDGLWPQQGMKRRLCTAWRVPDPCSSPVRAELVEAWTGSAAMVEQRAHPSTSSGRAGTNSRSRRAEWDWPRRTGALEALTPSRNATKVAELSRGWSLLPAFPQGGHCQRTLTTRRRATIADERGGE